MENKKTCLYDRHVALGAQIQPFAGFGMPIPYSSIIEKHQAVHQHCGVLDVSHMGEARTAGADAERYANRIFTSDVAGTPINQIFYGMTFYPDGGTVNGLLVYKMGENEFSLVFNAANVDKDVVWMCEDAEGFGVTIDHCSDHYGQLAVQGPEAEAVMKEVLHLDCKDLQFYATKTVDVDGENVITSRTGYTSEDGFEIYGSHAHIINTWDALMASERCVPYGLGCRDTLRFEVGLPLYGNELSTEISPIMAGLGMFCKLDREEFIGKEAIVKQKEEGVKQRAIGLELREKAIPRYGYAVLRDGRQVGVITTGYHAISVDKSMAFALVNKPGAKLGTKLEIQTRKKIFKCAVVKKGSYDKHCKKD